MFINAEPLFGIIDSYRFVWISGRLGGHKTSFAMALYQEFGERGYHLVSNNKNVWNSDMEKIKMDSAGHLKTVIMYDEGGKYVKANRQVEDIGEYANKMDIIFMFPSFWPPAKKAQILTIQTLFSLKSAGLPVIFYRWRVDLGAFHDKGWFIWLFPQEIYGIYSRQDPGADPYTITQWLDKKKNEYRRLYGHDDTISSLEVIESEDNIIDSMDFLSETLNEVGASLSKRKRGKR